MNHRPNKQEISIIRALTNRQPIAAETNRNERTQFSVCRSGEEEEKTSDDEEGKYEIITKRSTE